MFRRLAVAAFGSLCLALMSGCSERSRIVVESDVCWDGRVNDQASISSCGSKSFRVVGDLDCVVVQKRTVNGYLRVRIDSRPFAETTEPFGLLQVCR